MIIGAQAQILGYACDLGRREFLSVEIVYSESDRYYDPDENDSLRIHKIISVGMRRIPSFRVALLSIATSSSADRPRRTGGSCMAIPRDGGQHHLFTKARGRPHSGQ